MTTKSNSRDFRDSAFRPYTTAIGELSLAWNSLHEALAGLFWASLDIPNGVVPLSVWYSLKSDRAQRDMLTAVINANGIGHNLSANAREDIRWVIRKANAIEDLRNDILHTPLVNSGNLGIQPFHGLGHRRAKKLVKKNLLRELKWFYDTIIVLRDYSEKLQGAIMVNSNPWPDRPRLPNRGESSGT